MQAGQQAVVDPCSLRVLDAGGIWLDLTGQPRSSRLDEAGQALLRARNFEHYRDELLSGQAVNITEYRAAWHTILRAPAPVETVATERQRMIEFVRKADSERRWRNIVHIGIGGS